MMSEKSFKLWNSHFIQMCLSNLLLFSTLYMVFPILPFYMADHLNVSLSTIGQCLLAFPLGMLVIGPFHSYLIDRFERKTICQITSILCMGIVYLYTMVSSIELFLGLCFLHGAMFGVTSTLEITLDIDVTHVSCRNDSNIIFAWSSRLGMLIGIALGIILNSVFDFNTIIIYVIAAGVLSFIFTSLVKAPFRAPISIQAFSLDRFLLPRAWLPAINMLALTFSLGLLISLLCYNELNFTTQQLIYFFASSFIGFCASYIALKKHLMKPKTLVYSTSIFIILLATTFLVIQHTAYDFKLICLASLSLGAGLSILIPKSLAAFIKLSYHCQRCTANSTYLLVWEVGLFCGLAASCYFIDNKNLNTAYNTILVGFIVSFLLFLLATYRYFLKKKLRN